MRAEGDEVLVRVGEYVCGFEHERFPTLAEAVTHMETEHGWHASEAPE